MLNTIYLLLCTYDTLQIIAYRCFTYQPDCGGRGRLFRLFLPLNKLLRASKSNSSGRKNRSNKRFPVRIDCLLVVPDFVKGFLNKLDNGFLVFTCALLCRDWGKGLPSQNETEIKAIMATNYDKRLKHDFLTFNIFRYFEFHILQKEYILTLTNFHIFIFYMRYWTNEMLLLLALVVINSSIIVQCIWSNQFDTDIVYEAIPTIPSINIS